MRSSSTWGALLSLVVMVMAAGACSDDSHPGADLRPDGRGRDQALSDAADAAVPDLGTPDQPSKVERPPAAERSTVDLPNLPGNSACLKAQAVTLAGGKAKVTGTTVGLANEFSGAKCGADLVTPLLGPQAYYTMTMTGGKTYRFAVTAQFKGAFYLFSAAANCQQSQIESDCQSSGSKGAKLPALASGVTKEIYFTVKTTGTFLFAVDGVAAADSGAFTIDIEEVSGPANGTCATAQALTLTTGRATVQGNTYGGADEFAGAIKCGGSSAFSGPQVYYRLFVGAGKSYKLTLTPTFDAYVYIFSDSAGCSAGPINQYCASGGATGDKTSLIAGGSTKSIVFAPYPPAGNYIIAVDSSGSFNAGSFVLEIEEFSPPANGTCAAAQAITLSGGKASVTGTTFALKNEFASVKCGGYSALIGPQAYYSVAMTAGKAYKIALTPSFSAYVYVFQKSGGCAEASIEADCASKGATGDKWGSFSTASTMYFVPGSTGTYVIAIDSTGTSAQGDFTLAVEEVSPPANGTCGAAAPVALTGGQATVTGTTAGTKDELAGLKCGGYTAFAGPQVYYSMTMTAGKVYKMTFTPAFSAYLYVFAASVGCTQAAIETACASKGATGDKWGSFSSKTTLFFVPAATGTYVIGIDSTASSSQGEFTLDIVETVPPANATCATAQTVTLVAGKAVVTGSTVGAKDEFPTLKCGGYSTFVGPQVYYKVDLVGSKATQVTLAPAAGFSSAYVYFFSSSAGCTASAIDTACASKGTSGDKLGPYYSSTPSTKVFTPGSAGTYYLAVDSTSASYAGDFTLTIEQ